MLVITSARSIPFVATIVPHFAIITNKRTRLDSGVFQEPHVLAEHSSCLAAGQVDCKRSTKRTCSGGEVCAFSVLSAEDYVVK